MLNGSEASSKRSVKKSFGITGVAQRISPYASPFHSRSWVVRDLTALYGNDKLVRAGMATVESRIKVASDIIALRLQRKISIRLSATRESDRFSRVQFGALETLHQASLTDAERYTALQLTCINVYFSRCCLSERSRKAMHEGRFPFFSRPLRSLTIQGGKGVSA